MASGPVEIFNLALTKVGAAVVTAVDDGSAEAAICNAIWPHVRDLTLRDHPWNCATFRQQLSKLDATPVAGFSYQYSLPTDPYCLRVLGWADDTDTEPYKVEGNRYLLTDAAEAKIRYIGRVVDVTQYDELLVEAMACLLASKIAYALTEHASLAEGKFKEYKLALAEARSIDSQEGSPDDSGIDVLVDVRQSGRFEDWWRNRNSS
jgi:hypothetical protein